MGKKTFRLVMIPDENGKIVKKFIPEEEAQAVPTHAVYGDYLKSDMEHIQQAKDTLLANMFDAIKEISKNDHFWIVKELEDNMAIVGWKIHIPQMDYKITTSDVAAGAGEGGRMNGR